MPNSPNWTSDEDIVLVWFLSCGIKLSAVSKLIAHKCGTPQHYEQDIAHRAYKLHKESKRDTWEGFGPLLGADVGPIDRKDSWIEYNVDDWLIQKTSKKEHLHTLTAIAVTSDHIIRQVNLNDALIPELANEVLQEQSFDKIDWDRVDHRQRELVRKHISKYDENLHTLAATEHDDGV